MPHITRLERERRAAGLSQAALAFAARLAQPTVSKIEQFKLRTPSYQVLEKLARALRRHGRTVSAGELDPTTPAVVPRKPRPRKTEGKPNGMEPQGVLP
jgi:transcriptional regulator with XRE-family HTH domain